MVDSVECISHVKLDQHPLLFPLFARVDSFLHLNDVVQDVSAFDDPPWALDINLSGRGLILFAMILDKIL